MHWKCGFSLTAHEVTIKFLCPSPKDATRWYNELKRRSEIILLHVTRDYQVGNILRRGRYAKTHIASKKDSGSPCEIKYIMKSFLMESSSSLVNLINGIKMMKYLDHPGILKLFDVYETDQYVQLVTESFQSGDLFTALKTKGKYTEGDVALIMRELLKIVSYLHENLIIHRDIKPENVMIRQLAKPLLNNWTVKIIDFGIAVRMKGSQLETLRCGAPGYTAPEVLNREGYCLKADIFSCGVILHTLYMLLFIIMID